MIDLLDMQLIAVVQAGLPLVSRPYRAVAEALGLQEDEVIRRLSALKRQGLIRRWGVVVKHRQLGYRANAMIVLDVPDESVAQIGSALAGQDCVNLCYLRPRQAQWPYNLYCMIHGKDRDTVLRQWATLQQECNLHEFGYEVLFSRQCFKQRGAWYALREFNSAVKAEQATNRAIAYG